MTQPAEQKKTVRVAAALIVQDDRFLIARRSEGRHLAGYWEFPGGKIEAGESAQSACSREVHEELGCVIAVDSYFLTCNHEYEDFNLSMDVYICHMMPGEKVTASEAHSELRWITPDEMDSVEFAPADIAFLPNIRKFMQAHTSVTTAKGRSIAS